MQKKIEFLAIGDITTDAFIRLKEAEVTCDINKEHCKIAMNFADKIPYEFMEEVTAVGNSPNAAVAAARLGLTSALVANIGDDDSGKRCLASLEKDGVDTSSITAHNGIKTNYHYVLWYQDERTILVKHETYPYHLPEFPEPSWIYLSSLGGTSESLHQEIFDYLEQHPEVKLIFQPGTFQMKLGYEKLTKLYERTHVFICNLGEAQQILKTNVHVVTDLLRRLNSIGPKITIITDGPRGAYAIDSTVSPSRTYYMPPYPDSKPPYERTGAGDAFASTFSVAIALGNTVEEALRWAPINSMSVVQFVGAQKGLLTREAILKYLENAPADYKPKLLTETVQAFTTKNT